MLTDSIPTALTEFPDSMNGRFVDLHPHLLILGFTALLLSHSLT